MILGTDVRKCCKSRWCCNYIEFIWIFANFVKVGGVAIMLNLYEFFVVVENLSISSYNVIYQLEQ